MLTVLKQVSFGLSLSFSQAVIFILLYGYSPLMSSKKDHTYLFTVIVLALGCCICFTSTDAFC